MYNDLFSIGPVTIHGYGLMIGIGFLVAIFITFLRSSKRGWDPEIILDIALISVISGFLGAKLLYLIVEWKEFIKAPISFLGTSGFVVYGGIILALIANFFYFRKKKLDFLAYFDLIIPQLALAQGFGRIGCFLSGCCYGAPTDSFLGVVFPPGSNPLAGVKVWPTQLFSSAGDFAIAGILYLLGRMKWTKKGDIGAFYMILYGAGRFGIEFLRNDHRGSVGILSTSQFISIFIVLAGVGLFIFDHVKKEKAVDKKLDEPEEKENIKEENKENAED